LASFPKLADAGTQHTTVEQDNVRYVYQPLDELYMVLITNRQSNILQDIDSLHLFAQVVSSICKSLDEREILKHAFELLSAFDEVVTQGYRENLSLTQIKTFLEMESHEERVQEIISRVRGTDPSLTWSHVLKIGYRIRSLRLLRNGRGKLSNWSCNGKRQRGVVVLLLLVLRPTQLTLQRSGPMSLQRTMHTRPIKRNPPRKVPPEP
jgi:hypothetical protein